MSVSNIMCHSSLIEAAKGGCTECVNLFIDKEVGSRDKYGMTALMYAANNGHTECVKLLMDKEIGLRDNKGETAIMRAATNGETDIVKLLVPHEAGLQDNFWGRSALMWAAQRGSASSVKLLIDKESGLQDNWGMSALMWAAQHGYHECAELLIDKEAGLQDDKGMSALMYAAKSGRTECIELLIPHEADIVDKEGKSALNYAMEYNKHNCVKILCNTDNSLFSLIFSPNIPIGSFLDILNKAAKQSGKNYDYSMVEISDKLEKLSVSVLQEYLAISDIKILESRLINDFPEYKEKIPQVIQELETEELICPICLDESIQMYRNCVNCTCYACKECWEKIDNCMLCRSALYWKKCLNLELLQKVD